MLLLTDGGTEPGLELSGAREDMQTTVGNVAEGERLPDSHTSAHWLHLVAESMRYVEGHLLALGQGTEVGKGGS